MPLYPNDRELWKSSAHTCQPSDHLPLWVRIDSWIEDEQLDTIRAGGWQRRLRSI